MQDSNGFTAFLRTGLVFVLGAIAAFGMAPGYHWYALLVALSLFYIFYVGTKTGKGAALLAFAFSLGYFMHGLYWIGNALLVDGNDFKWVWPISFIGLPILLSLFYGLCVGLGRKFSNPGHLTGFLMLAAMMSLAEWARGTLFSGFPWNMVSHTWVGYLSVLQTVSIAGAFFLSLLTFIWFLFPGWLVISGASARTKTVVTVLILASFLNCYFFGLNRLNTNPPQNNDTKTIRIVQPNITQEDKWNPELVADHFNTLISLSDPYKNASTDKDHETFIIWPETAIPPQILDSASAGNIIQANLQSYPHDAYLLTGALRRSFIGDDVKYHNSLLIMDSSYNGLGLYDKSHLVPFGEYIPFQNWIPIKPVVEFHGFTPGTGTQTIKVTDSFGITPLICYEVIFDEMARGGQKRPDLIVNVTNDGWYGDSAGPRQHFAQTIIRAVEYGVPVARSANTGISGLIDPLGRIMGKIDFSQKTALSLPLPQKISKKTLYHNVKNIPFFTFVCMLLLAGFLYKKRS